LAKEDVNIPIRKLDKVLEALKPFAGKGCVLQASLIKDKDEELRASMEGRQPRRN
jgi:uncharacterized membrane protein